MEALLLIQHEDEVGLDDLCLEVLCLMAILSVSLWGLHEQQEQNVGHDETEVTAVYV